MAYDYKNLPVLSKVKIGDQVYYLKDAEVRALIDTFGDAVSYNVDATVADKGEGLVTSGAVHAYVTKYVTDITGGAMTFIGIKEELPATGNPGEVVIVGTAEYVYADGKWNLYGDEGIYATIVGVDKDYVKKTLTIAGIDLEDAITADELKTALGLKSLAYKDSATVTVTDYATDIEGAAYKPEGSISVSVTNTTDTVASAGQFKPAGNVSGTTVAAGSVAIARDDVNGVAVSGTVSAPAITVTPNTTSVQHIASLGELPSYTAAQYVAPSVSEAKSSFAAEGLVAKVGEGEDAEILVFSAASKADALTTTGFNAGSYTDATFNAGALPAFGDAINVVTGIKEAKADAPVFTGDKFGATFTGAEADIVANFEGTEATVNVSGNYEKATSAAGSFTGTEATITPTLTKGTKAITVQ